MALINCPECGKEASDLAEKCPNCGYPFKHDEIKNEDTPVETLEEPIVEPVAKLNKNIERKPWVVPVAIIASITLMLIAACITISVIMRSPAVEAAVNQDDKSISETDKGSSKKSEGKNSDATYEEMLSADVQNTVDLITEKYNSLEAEITDYNSYKANCDKINEWYSYCMEQSSALYAQIAEDTYNQDLGIAKGGLKEYEEWDDSLTDTYRAWDDAMEDYYRAWNDLYEDAYGFFDDVISDADDDVSYDEISDAWEDMYDMYSDSWEDMYDLYSDAWDDLYDFHSDVYGEFYDGNTDIKEAYEKVFPE